MAYKEFAFPECDLIESVQFLAVEIARILLQLFRGGQDTLDSFRRCIAPPLMHNDGLRLAALLWPDECQLRVHDFQEEVYVRRRERRNFWLPCRLYHQP